MQMEVRQIVGDPSEGDQETLVIAGILSNLSNHARFCARSGTIPRALPRQRRWTAGQEHEQINLHCSLPAP